MNDFKAMKFIREVRDKIYEETKNKSSEEIKKYYTERSNWIKPLLKKKSSKTIKTRNCP
jgi:hypothetical protein